MTKTYKIEVDCANCAREMEEAAAKISGVQSDVYKRQEFHGSKNGCGIP